MQNPFSKTCYTLSLLLTLSSPAFSKPVIVEAMHHDIKETYFTKSVSILTEEDLENSKIDTLGEALRNIPGLTLRNSGGIGKQSSIQIRGGASSQTLVMFDGVQGINSPTVGLADLGSLFNTGIEQVEVIRSGSGVIHNSGAQAGVVNIITKRGEGPAIIDFLSEFGSDRTFRETISFSGSSKDPEHLPFKEAYYAFSATRTDSAGIGQESDFGGWYFTGRTGVDINDHINFDIVSRFYRSHVGLDTVSFPGFEPVGLNSSTQEDALLTVKPELNFYFENYESSTSFSGVFQNTYARGSGFENENMIDRKRFDTIHHIFFPEISGISNTFTFGYDFIRERANIEDLANISSAKNIHSVDTHGVYFMHEADWKKIFFLTGGVRVIDHQLYKTDHVWSTSAAIRFPEIQSKLIASYDQSFGNPTLSDLYSPFGGNTNLRAEKGDHYELGYEQTFIDERLKVKTAYFRTRYEDLISFVLTGAFTFTTLNVDSAEIDGVESEILYDITDSLTIGANHTYLHTKDNSQGDKPLQLTPRNTFNFLINWDITDKLLFHFDMTTTSSVRQNSTPYKPNGYYKADASFTYEVNENFDTYVRVENLFNDQYQTNPGFNQPGAQFFLGGKLTFGGEKN